MDIDISDILASVSRPTGSHHTSLTDTSVHTDHQQLIRAWTSERCTPSLLPYPAPLIARITSRLQLQIQRIEDLTSSMPDSSMNGYAPSTNDELSRSKNLNLILSVLQTDLGRTQFLLRSYLRQRLGKLTTYPVHYLQLLDRQPESQSNQSSTSASAPLLSDSEAHFLRHHQALLSNFYSTSFLDSLPARLRRLDDTSGGMGNNMVDAPDPASAVVVRCLEDFWGNAEEVERGRDGKEGEEKASVELRMRRGEVWVVRWGDVRGGVVGGALEVL
jgi:GINS complex subunit 4